MRNRKRAFSDDTEMTRNSKLTKYLFFVGVVALILLNLYTFIAAFPETYTPSPGINTSGTVLAKDFSAYYIGAWRLWNNPSQIYTLGALHGCRAFDSALPGSLQIFAFISCDCFALPLFKLSRCPDRV